MNRWQHQDACEYQLPCESIDAWDKNNNVNTYDNYDKPGRPGLEYMEEDV